MIFFYVADFVLKTLQIIKPVILRNRLPCVIWYYMLDDLYILNWNDVYEKCTLVVTTITQNKDKYQFAYGIKMMFWSACLTFY